MYVHVPIYTGDYVHLNIADAEEIITDTIISLKTRWRKDKA